MDVRYDGIGKQFQQVAALVDLNLTVPDGTFLVLLGPSGCGKTTTLRCVAGLEHPTSGSISIAGRIVSSPAADVYVPPRLRDLGIDDAARQRDPLHLTTGKSNHRSFGIFR